VISGKSERKQDFQNILKESKKGHFQSQVGCRTGDRMIIG